MSTSATTSRLLMSSINLLTKTSIRNSSQAVSTTKLINSSSFAAFKRSVQSNPLQIPNQQELAELTESETMTLLHSETMDNWREISRKLYAVMDTSNITNEAKLPTNVAAMSAIQIKTLMEDFIENGSPSSSLY